MKNFYNSPPKSVLFFIATFFFGYSILREFFAQASFLEITLFGVRSNMPVFNKQQFTDLTHKGVSDFLWSFNVLDGVYDDNSHRAITRFPPATNTITFQFSELKFPELVHTFGGLSTVDGN